MKYLGVCILKNLSRSTYVNTVCSKAKRILGLRFYNHSTSEVMLQLYLSLVRPHMEYAETVWSPHLRKDTAALECTKFALSTMHGVWPTRS